MKKLSRYCTVLFCEKEISRQQLRLFTEDHLEKLKVQNTHGQYDALLQQTQTIYNEYFGEISNADTAQAVRQSRTKSMNQVVKKFKKEVQERRKLIAYLFKEKSPAYKEFFPAGATEYTNASLENVETLMVRISTASIKHQKKLGAETGEVFNELLASFRSARGTQLTQKGLVSIARQRTMEAEQALQRQLTVNLLTIAVNHLGNPNAMRLFFNEAILCPPKKRRKQNRQV